MCRYDSMCFLLFIFIIRSSLKISKILKERKRVKRLKHINTYLNDHTVWSCGFRSLEKGFHHIALHSTLIHIMLFHKFIITIILS
ncbi:hypothetical protein HanPSC8_Chr09g0398091 [Helianthus annuus]|nr:hypothetical protein HanPSC8_Chr09g0398091 [Helianthus annuus]